MYHHESFPNLASLSSTGLRSTNIQFLNSPCIELIQNHIGRNTFIKTTLQRYITLMIYTNRPKLTKKLPRKLASWQAIKWSLLANRCSHQIGSSRGEMTSSHLCRRHAADSPGRILSRSTFDTRRFVVEIRKTDEVWIELLSWESSRSTISESSYFSHHVTDTSW